MLSSHQVLMKRRKNTASTTTTATPRMPVLNMMRMLNRKTAKRETQTARASTQRLENGVSEREKNRKKINLRSRPTTIMS